MSTSIKADGDELLKSAERIGATPQQIRDILIKSVNAVAVPAFQKSKQKIAEQVNLPRSYVDSKMRLELATDRPTATMTGAGRGVLLAKFGATQSIKPASSRAKGNSKLGIPRGYKADGVKVKVKAAGQGGKLDHGFFMQLRNGNGLGVFTRDRFGKVRVRYGPSVDQVFNGVSQELDSEIAEDLRKNILNELEKL